MRHAPLPPGPVLKYRSLHVTPSRWMPGGGHATLIASITQRPWPRCDSTLFIPGHGPECNFGERRRSSPCLRGT